MVGRLVPYKKFDLGIKVFNKLGLPLKIIGDGPQYKKLRRIAKKNVELLGGLESSSKELVDVYQNCKALIYPQEEDFGLVPLEAMALGKPVIAYKKGGVVETVKEGVTGTFFNKQDELSLKKAIKRFEKMEFNPQVIREHAKSFSKARFKQEILDFVENKVKEFKNN